MSKLFATIALIATTSAQDNRLGVEFGFCPTKPVPVGNFTPERYQGNWYEIKRDKYLWYERDVDCVTASYFFQANRPFYPVSVNNQKYEYENDTVTNTLKSNGDSNLVARFDADGNGKVRSSIYPEGNYQILDTDYNNYTIVYGCDDWFFSFTREAWILSRTPRLDQKYIDIAMNIIEKKVGKNSGATDYYNTNRMMNTQQGGWCKYNLDANDSADQKYYSTDESAFL